MPVQEPLSLDEFEEYTQVSGLTTAQYATLASDIASVLSVAAAAFVNPAGTIAYTGTTYVVGVTMIPLATLKAGLLGSAIFGAGLISTVLSGPLVLTALGIPVAQAKQMVAERSIKNGFAIGCVIGIFGFGKLMVNDFKVRTSSPGFAPEYMRGVSQNAFNAGLAIGYSASLKLKGTERDKYLKILTTKLIEDAKSDGRKLYMQGWSDRTWIYEYARVFERL